MRVLALAGRRGKKRPHRNWILHIIVGVNAMDARRLMLPAAALVGAAVLGRLIGLKGLVRAGVAALTVANVSKSAGLLTDETPPVRRRARRNGRTTRKRTTRKSSAKKTASAGTH